MLLALRKCRPSFTPNSFLRLASGLAIPKAEDGTLPLAPRLEKRLARIEKYSLRDVNTENVRAVLHSTVSPSRRPEFLERGIRALLVSGDYFSAILAYERLVRDGHSPSPATTRSILDIAPTHPRPLPLHIIQTLTTAVLADNSMPKRDQFHSFIRLVRQAGDPQLFSRKLHEYLKAQGTSWAMSPGTYALIIDSFGQLKRPDQAEGWLSKYRKQLQEGTIQADAAPYVARMALFVQDEPVGYRMFWLVRGGLNRIIQDGVAPSIETFHVIMSAARRVGLYHRLFEYATLLQKYFTPDAYTFSMLFTILQKPSIQCGKHIPNSDIVIPTPHSLFHQALAIHQHHTRGRPTTESPVLTTGVLNAALTAFMSRGEYAGAIVVLRSFAICSIMPNERTGWIVRLFILQRLQSEFRRERKRPWASKDDDPLGRMSTWKEALTGEVSDAHATGSSVGATQTLRFFEDALRHRPFSRTQWMEYSRKKEQALLRELEKEDEAPPADSQSSRHIAPGRRIKEGGGYLRGLIRLVERCALAEVGISPSAEDMVKAHELHKIMAPVQELILPPRRPPVQG